MRDVPTDIGSLQADFEDTVCAVLEDAGFEVLDRNPTHDPFEPDIVLMDEDEWVFNVICYFVEDAPFHGVAEIFPLTFDMRKWVQDDSDKPAFLALGIGGIPSEPEYLYFSRFFNFNDRLFDMDRNRGLLVNWLRPPFLRKVIEDEFERIFSPL